MFKQRFAAISFYRLLLLAGSLSLLSACGSVAVTEEQIDESTPVPGPAEKPAYVDAHNQQFNKITDATTKPEKDRAAILAMQGEHKVGFHFEETVILENDYQRKAPKDSGAFETVIVLEDQPDHIVLQHLLIAQGGHVVKHWRQDWSYETEKRLEFVEDQTWELVSLPEEKQQGAWTQCVYEVSDAPRYCGTGKWNHKYGVSTWTSDRTWRPLPRREYSTRNDYNAINAENRHTVTPLGWTHEQDNTKTVREGRDTDKTLVREFGFNDYLRIDGYDFSPAYDYWTKTSEYWRKVRDIWSERIAEKGRVRLKTEVDGMPIIVATFQQAAGIKGGKDQPSQEEIEAIFNEWVALAP